MCPKGDDPFTVTQENRTITITTSALSGTLGGQFKLSYYGQSFYFDADASLFDGTSCETSFNQLPNVKRVSCSRTAPTAVQGATYTVQFISFPLQPYENNIYSHEGNPQLINFQCDTSLVSSGASPSCLLADVSPTTEIKGKHTLLSVPPLTDVCRVCLLQQQRDL
jgi:hypothetical protein